MLTQIDWRNPVHSGKKLKIIHALGPQESAYICGQERRFMRSGRWADEQATGQPRCAACAELVKTAIA